MRNLLIITIILFFTNTLNAQFSEQLIEQNKDYKRYAIENFVFDVDGDGDKDMISSFSDEANDTILYITKYFKNTDGKGNYEEQKIIDYNIIIKGIGDFDNDGDIDFAATQEGIGRTCWYENNNGSFNKHIICNSATGSMSTFTIADIDNDNDLDIIFVLKRNASISLFENTDGLGTFSEEQILDDDIGGVTNVEFADIDKDGNIDMFCGELFTGNVLMYKNSGAINFDEPITVGNFYHPAVVKITDIDNDNDFDIIASSSDYGKIICFKNLDGSGNFVSETIIDNHGYNELILQDFNKDGNIDIFGFKNESVHWFENTDGTNFIYNNYQTHLLDMRGISIEDIDNNSEMDIICYSNQDAKIIWCKNEDVIINTFNPNNVTSLIGFNSVYSFDIDKDGDLDVIATSYFNNKILWYENLDGIGNFSESKTLITDVLHPNNLIFTDINGDGDKDIIVVNKGENLSWYENLGGNGNFSNKKIISNSIIYSQKLYSSDIDKDGDNDIVLASSSEGIIAWYENADGNGRFSEHILYIGQIYSIFPSDINNDGNTDIIACIIDNESLIKIISFNNNGNGDFTTNIICEIGTARNYRVKSPIQATDIDNDGDDDILLTIYEEAPDLTRLNWYENNGDGTFTNIHLISDNWMNFPISSFYITDIDNDGDVDITASKRYFDIIIWYENLDGLGNFDISKFISQSIHDSYSLDGGDFNNDGQTDILAHSFRDEKIAWYKNEIIIGIKDVKNIELVVYPNPTSGIINFKFKEKINKIDIFDITGKKQKIKLEKNQIDISDLENGIYLINIVTQKGSVVKRIIKQ